MGLVHDSEKEAHRGGAVAGGDQQGLGAGEVDPARAPVNVAPAVGAAATCRGAGGLEKRDIEAD